MWACSSHNRDSVVEVLMWRMVKSWPFIELWETLELQMNHLTKNTLPCMAVCPWKCIDVIFSRDKNRKPFWKERTCACMGRVLHLGGGSDPYYTILAHHRCRHGNHSISVTFKTKTTPKGRCKCNTLLWRLCTVSWDLVVYSWSWLAGSWGKGVLWLPLVFLLDVWNTQLSAQSSPPYGSLCKLVKLKM